MNIQDLLQRFPDNMSLNYIQTDIQRYTKYYLSANHVIYMTTPITDEMINIALEEHLEREKLGYANSLELLSIDYAGRNLRVLKDLFNQIRKNAVLESMKKSNLPVLENVDMGLIADKIISYV